MASNTQQKSSSRTSTGKRKLITEHDDIRCKKIRLSPPDDNNLLEMKISINLLNHNSSDKVIVNCLIKLLKTHLSESNMSEKVREFSDYGGIGNLVSILNRDNEKVIELALHILGHCSADKECLKTIANTKAILFLTNILKNIKNDKMLGNVCQIFANMASDKNAIITIQSSDAIPIIIKFLLSNKHPSSEQKAIKALTNLRNNAEQHEEIVRLIATQFNPDNNETLIKIITALASLTTPCTEMCAKQIKTSIGMSNLSQYSKSSDKDLQKVSDKLLKNIEKILKNEMISLIELLSNESADYILKALLKLQKLFSQRRKVKEFSEKDGLKNLLPLINKPNKKLIEIAIYILMKCCKKSKNHKIIASKNTFSSLKFILQHFNNDNLQRNVCEICSYLALEPEIVITIHKVGIIPIIVNYFLKTKQEKCQQSAIKALKKLSNNAKHRLIIIKALGSKYNPKDKAHIKKVIISFSELTKNCTELCANYIENLVNLSNLVTFSKCSDIKMQQAALTILTDMVGSQSQTIITKMIQVGAISLFVKQVEQFLQKIDTESENKLKFVKAFCVCCFKYADVYKSEKILMPLLNCPSEEIVQNYVIPTISSVIYSDKCLEKYVEMGLIPIVVDKLADCLNNNVNKHSIQEKEVKIEAEVFKLFPDLGSHHQNQHSFAPLDSDVSYVNQLLKIFSQIINKQKYHLHFQKETVIDTLLQAVASAADKEMLTKAMEILTCLVGNKTWIQFLLITCQFPLKVYKMLNESVLQHPADSCQICKGIQTFRPLILKTLTEQTESHDGISTVNELFSKGELSEKNCAALMIFLLGNLNGQKSFDYQVLEVILQMVEDENNAYFTKGLICVSKMCRQINLETQQDKVNCCFLNSDKDKFEESSKIFSTLLNGKLQFLTELLKCDKKKAFLHEIKHRTMIVFENHSKL